MTVRRLRAGRLLAAGVLALGSLACASAASAVQGPGDVLGRDLLFVANQDAAKVTVIDMDRNEVLRIVDVAALGYGANAKPHDTAVEPDGSYWYVSLIGAGKVLKLDPADRVVGEADFEAAGMLALDPVRDRLFVGRSMSAVNPPQRLGVIRRSDMSIEEADVFFPRPHALAVHPGTGEAYTASMVENRLAALHPETDEVDLVDLPGPPHSFVQFALSPDRRWLVLSGHMTNQVLVFRVADDGTPSLEKAIDVNAWPWHPAFTPDGGRVYIGNQAANTVTVIDTGSWSVAAVIEGPGLAEPSGAAFSPDGRRAYVSNRNLKGEYTSPDPDVGSTGGTVVVIDTTSNRIVKVIDVPLGAAGISTRPGS